MRQMLAVATQTRSDRLQTLSIDVTAQSAGLALPFPRDIPTFIEHVHVLPEPRAGKNIDAYTNRMEVGLGAWMRRYQQTTRHKVYQCLIHLDGGKVLEDGSAQRNSTLHPRRPNQ